MIQRLYVVLQIFQRMHSIVAHQHSPILHSCPQGPLVRRRWSALFRPAGGTSQLSAYVAL